MSQLQTLSRAELLQMASRLAEEYGESLTLTAFRRETGLSQWAIFDLFGNWKNLRIAIGLTPEAPRNRNPIPKARTLELARELAAKHGEKLTEWLFLKQTGLSGQLIQRQFGSWGALRTAVGLKPRAKAGRHYTEAEIVADLYRVWRHRGTPKYHMHRRNGGKISAATMRDWFGSWEVVVAVYRAHCRNVEGWTDPVFGVYCPSSADRNQPPGRVDGFHQTSTSP